MAHTGVAMNHHNLPADEEADIRAAITAALEAWLRHSGLTQTAAADLLGTTQARVSEIKHGKTSQFSLDLLVRFAARAGLQPRLTLTAP
jgi:predicted XRE-type DNA-binding protein